MSKPVLVPSERLRSLIAKTKPREPYEIADGLAIPPLTPKRDKAMTEARGVINAQQSMLQIAARRAMSPRPTYPNRPIAPEPPEKPNQAQAKAYAALVESYTQAINAWPAAVQTWEGLQSEWEASFDKLQDAMAVMQEKITAAQDDYQRALFGAQHDEIVAFFADLDVEIWNVFVEDLNEAFGITAKAEQIPDDGKCKSCGHIEDEEAAGKAPESSTS